MKILTIKVDDEVYEKFIWLLDHFPSGEVKILQKDTYVDDDAYHRGIKGGVKAVHESRIEPMINTDTLKSLEPATPLHRTPRRSGG
ncbi:MAG: hypothetical protein HQL49_12140 [Gammaproteobacteria bacterium]|nr:hypothetical protein [Gammaproteobacteria bacterium]